MRTLARRGRNIARILRLRLWALRLDAVLRLRGGRLELDAAPGAGLTATPRLQVSGAGDGSGVLRIRIEPGVTIERDVHLRIDARRENELVLCEDAELHAGARLWLFGGSIRLGKGAVVRDLALLKSSGSLVLGDYVRFGYASVIHCHERIELRNRAGLADLIFIIDSDHTHDGTDTWVMSQPVRPTPVVIGSNVLVGSSCVITRGAVIGANSIVAARSVVRSGDTPEGWLVGGAPARPLRPLGDAEMETTDEATGA